MSRVILFVAIATLMFSGCVSKKQKENTLSLSGAFALYPMAVKWSEEYKKENNEVRFNISGGGAGKGMADALAQTVDLGMFSREIAEEEIRQGAWWIGLCKDAVLPTISASNMHLELLKKRGITREEFVAIFVDGSINDWSELLKDVARDNMQVYTRSDACGAAGTWASYLGSNQEGLLGIGIHGDPGLAEAVAKDATGVGYNNTAYIYDITTGKKHPGIEVIPIDINGNGRVDAEEDFYGSFDAVLEAISDGRYPSPPARELYFVSKGKPSKQATIDFLKWTLTKGQKYVAEAGYVPISQEKLKEYIEKLEK